MYLQSPLLKNSPGEDFDQEKELEFLSNLTKQVHEKFINQWTGVQLDKQLNLQAQQHVDSVNKQKGMYLHLSRHLFEVN